MVHMKKFALEGDYEGKETSLFVVPVGVKGEQRRYFLHRFCETQFWLYMQYINESF